MKKSELYQVRCTEFVANEMVRYENATIVKKESPDAGRWAGSKVELEYTTFRFTIQSPAKNIRRWASFGIRL